MNHWKESDEFAVILSGNSERSATAAKSEGRKEMACTKVHP